MKKIRPCSFLFILLLLVSITACDNEKDPEPTKTDMLAAHNWQGEKALVAGINIADHSQFAGLLPDFTTMTLTFKKDGTYTASYTSNGQQVPLSGNWEFRENETKLHFDLLNTFGVNETLGITELSATRLTLTTFLNYQGFEFPADIYFIGI